MVYAGNWLLGTTTSNQVALPEVTDVETPYVEYGNINESLSGSKIKTVFGRKKQFTLNFGLLTDAEYAQLDAYWNGTNGVGPFYLTDPRNSVRYTVLVQDLNDTSPMQGWRDGISMVFVEA